MNIESSAATYVGAPRGEAEPLRAPASPSARTQLTRACALLLLAISVGIRFYQYLWDRSLWVDEAALANNILTRGFGELATTLSDNQAAPLGFLYLERAVTLIGGPGEYSLRFVPFVAGLVALLLFWDVARRLLSPSAALVGLGLFAVSPRIVYYAAEVKQYSTDVALGLALLAVFIRIRSEGLDSRNALIFGVSGAVGVWFSQTLVFYLAALGMALVLDQRSMLQQHFSRFAAVAGVWVASSSVAILVSRNMVSGHHPFLDSWWSAGFLPLPPSSAADWSVWGAAYLRLFRDPLGFTVPVLAALACLFGIAWLLRGRRFADAALLAGPLCLTMLAAGLRLYPFGDTVNHGGRVLLFLAPVVLLLVAHGVAETAGAFRVRPSVLALGLLAPFLILRFEPAVLVPLYRAFPGAVHWVFIPPLPRFDIDSQPVGQVLRRVVADSEPSDRYYVYTVAGPTFAYYADRLGLDPTQYVRGAAEGTTVDDVRSDLQPLRGSHRVWVVFAYAPGDIPNVFIRELNAMGRILSVVEEGPVGALLYDLSGS
jgi:4-amino-4-deoxy-L-arabinose transferase-like glycosyltransferase